MEKNNDIFKDKSFTPNCVVAQGISILSFFPQEKEIFPRRVLVEIQIDKSKYWPFFDGASQKNNHL
jgi:hypothetical protein